MITLLVLLALFSPIADPARISVDDQLARIANGTIAADKLDLTYLRWDAGRFGKAALETIIARQGDSDTKLHDDASRLLAATNRFEPNQPTHPLAGNLTIHTADGKLPDSFLTQEWSPSDDTLPICLRAAASPKCDVFVKDVKGNGAVQVIIVQGNTATGFDRDTTGIWHLTARWISLCGDTNRALQNGDFAAAAPEPAPWPDLEVAGQRLHFAAPSSPAACSNASHG